MLWPVSRRKRSTDWSYDMRTVLFAMVLGLSLSAAASGAVIGPWDVQSAPQSATLVSGGGSSWGWLNVANSAVSVSEAFSGMPILNDGYANADNGTIVELNFAAGDAKNVAGPDLVMFDAHYDTGAYVVSTSYDSFAAELFLPVSSFINTGESRVYYYEKTAGTYSATIWGAAFDLSDLGVPMDTSVAAVRFRAASAYNTQADPIGMGALAATVPEPTTLAIWSALGGLGLIAARRRRKVA